MQLVRYKETLSKNLRRWLEPLFVEKQPLPTTHRCAISFTTQELTYVHINKASTATAELIQYERLPLNRIDNLSSLLQRFHNPEVDQSIPLTWLLTPDDYQLFLIDALPVADSELTEALHWRIRSLINYSVDEAVTDYFKLPPKKAATENMLAAITAKREMLSSIINMIKKSGLSISTITIPEIAMRHLTDAYENDEKCTAFIYFYDNSTILNISCKQILYFTRRVPFSIKSVTSNNGFEKFSLEILRYFDFFQTQWRLPSPRRIFVAAENMSAREVAEQLSNYLQLAIEPMGIKSLAHNALQHQPINNGLLTVGSILNEEAIYAASRN